MSSRIQNKKSVAPPSRRTAALHQKQPKPSTQPPSVHPNARPPVRTYVKRIESALVDSIEEIERAEKLIAQEQRLLHGDDDPRDAVRADASKRTKDVPEHSMKGSYSESRSPARQPSRSGVLFDEATISNHHRDADVIDNTEYQAEMRSHVPSRSPRRVVVPVSDDERAVDRICLMQLQKSQLTAVISKYASKIERLERENAELFDQCQSASRAKIRQGDDSAFDLEHSDPLGLIPSDQEIRMANGVEAQSMMMTMKHQLLQSRNECDAYRERSERLSREIQNARAREAYLADVLSNEMGRVLQSLTTDSGSGTKDTLNASANETAGGSLSSSIRSSGDGDALNKSLTSPNTSINPNDTTKHSGIPRSRRGPLVRRVPWGAASSPPTSTSNIDEHIGDGDKIANESSGIPLPMKLVKKHYDTLPASFPRLHHENEPVKTTGAISDDDSQPSIEATMEKCDTCGRSFRSDRIARHQDICQKLADSKRKTYNSAHVRQHDSVAPLYAAQELTFTPTITKSAVQLKRLSPTKADVDRSRYTSCPSCGRLFSPRAAQRHVPICTDLSMSYRVVPHSQYRMRADRSTRLPKLDMKNGETSTKTVNDDVPNVESLSLSPSKTDIIDRANSNIPVPSPSTSTHRPDLGGSGGPVPVSHLPVRNTSLTRLGRSISPNTRPTPNP